jgi:hypothetical protein
MHYAYIYFATDFLRVSALSHYEALFVILTMRPRKNEQKKTKYEEKVNKIEKHMCIKNDQNERKCAISGNNFVKKRSLRLFFLVVIIKFACHE